MGAVYLGRDTELNRPVAIKVIREEVHDQEVLDRFFHEARAAAALRHPNIITIYASGQHEHQPYMVMEFVDGESLGEIIRSRRNVSIGNKLSYLEQVCSGLHFAHRAGIIHRDIKPANVMVDKEGMVRILDFGIARIEGSVMTQGGALIGSVNYMSPEQMLGRSIDHRSDIFSVGSLAYELFSYQQAFKGGLNDGLLQRLPYEHPPSIGEICPGLPVGVEGVIVRALQKAPEDRFEDLAEMRTAIIDIQRRLDSTGDQNTIMILREALQASLGAVDAPPPASTPLHVEPDHTPDLMPLEWEPEVDVFQPVDVLAPPVIPEPPVPGPQTWQVKKRSSDTSARRPLTTATPPSSGTSRPPSSRTSKSPTAGTSRPPSAVLRPAPSTASSRTWIVMGSAAVALLIGVAVAIPWLTAAPSDPLDHERPGIEAAMERFRIGYRNRDLRAVREAFPALPRDVQQTMQRTFSDCLVYEVTFDRMAVALTPGISTAALADVRSTHTCTPQSTGRQTTAVRHDIYALGKEGDTWVIEGVAAAPASSVDRSQ